MTSLAVSPAAGTRERVDVLLDRYRAGLPGLSDVELAHRASAVAVLPGRVGDELRRAVDAEGECRQAARRAAVTPRRPGLVRLVGVAALVAVPAYASYLTGQDMAGRLDVPQQVVWAPVVAAAVAGVAVTAAGVARWRDHLRYGRNEVLDDADLDPRALALIDRIRARRGEVG